MNPDTVLWWSLALVVIAGAYTYRQEVADIFWNPPSGQDNSLFATNPAEYTAHIIAEGVKGIF